MHIHLSCDTLLESSGFAGFPPCVLKGRFKGDPLLTEIKRHCNSMPQYNVGHQDRVARIKQRLPPTLAIAGSALYGVGVRACVRSGQAAASRILETLQPANVQAGVCV